MTDQTPRTEAGRPIGWATCRHSADCTLDRAAIEAEAAAQARTEALRTVEGAYYRGQQDALREAAERVRALVRYQFVAANGEFVSLDDLWAILAGETE